jgi:hypothetical protein
MSFCHRLEGENGMIAILIKECNRTQKEFDAILKGYSQLDLKMSKAKDGGEGIE